MRCWSGKEDRTSPAHHVPDPEHTGAWTRVRSGGHAAPEDRCPQSEALPQQASGLTKHRLREVPDYSPKTPMATPIRNAR